MARRAGGRWLVLGDGEIVLPLVYIDDVVDSLMLAAKNGLHAGEVIQIVDPEPWSQNQVLSEVYGADARVIRVPRPVVMAMGKMSELVLGLIGKKSPVSEYRLKSALARRRFESRRAAELLDWRPRVGVREGIRRAQQGEG